MRKIILLFSTIGMLMTLTSWATLYFYEKHVSKTENITNKKNSSADTDYPKKENVDGEFQKAWVKAYGIFGFKKDYVENENISLTPPDINRKAKLGSYIGCTYLLNDKLFKNGENTLDIFVDVKVIDYNGNAILRDRWPNIAYKFNDDTVNAAVFKVEEGELFQGNWIFTVTHNGDELFSQIVPVIIEKSQSKEKLE